MEDRQKLIAGFGLLAVALVVAVLVIASSDSDGDGGGDDGGAELACTLATSGATLVAAGLTEGRTAGAIIAGVGGTAVVGYGCSQGIKALVNKPDEPVALTVENPDGTIADGTVTGSELAQPPPAESNGTCADWDSIVFFRWCLEGTIGPPA